MQKQYYQDWQDASIFFESKDAVTSLHLQMNLQEAKTRLILFVPPVAELRCIASTDCGSD